jgi:hypothetical protein
MLLRKKEGRGISNECIFVIGEFTMKQRGSKKYNILARSTAGTRVPSKFKK